MKTTEELKMCLEEIFSDDVRAKTMSYDILEEALSELEAYRIEFMMSELERGRVSI